MDKPTKEEHHEIYKKALHHYEPNRLLCVLIFECSETWPPDKGISHTEHLFPELGSHRPTFYVGAGWWPMDDEGVKKRIEVLKDCIERTKPDQP